MGRISGTVQPGPRLWKMLRKQDENWIREQEESGAKQALWLIAELLLLTAAVVLLLVGLPILAAVFGY